MPEARGDSAEALISRVARLRDPAVRLLTADEFNLFFDEFLGKPHFGVGFREVLSIDILSDGSVEFITAPEGSPADQGGLQAVDLLLAINQTNVRGLPLQQVVSLTRLGAGQRVGLLIERNGRSLKRTFKAQR
ncbi:PDZ domain-containing protein [Larkinella soli]|uniref:PDZ domain-containing protein n=1 Tax=Larkinella soli TaxID=1770527 RepID=UPI000FFB0F25|nr:PDZ domain-containing protein [Larkinella soli]